jgi:hypothetical protein
MSIEARETNENSLLSSNSALISRNKARVRLPHKLTSAKYRILHLGKFRQAQHTMC